MGDLLCVKFGLESLCGLFLLDNQEVGCRHGWGCPRRTPSLPSGRDPAVDGAFQHAPEGRSGRSGGLAGLVDWQGRHASAKGGRGSPALFSDMLGIPRTPAGAALPSAACLLKSTGSRASFGYPPPPGGGGAWPWPGSRHRPKGSRSSHYPDTVPRDPDQVTTSSPPHRAHRPCVALETGPGADEFTVKTIARMTGVGKTTISVSLAA